MPSFVPMRGLRIEDELYLKLKIVAKNENRSYNQQAVFVLKKFIADYETQNGVIIVNTDELYE